MMYVARALSESVYLGREIATAQRVVLAKRAATDASFEELTASFGYRLEGVAPLRAIVAAADGGVLCIEAIPNSPSLAEGPVARPGAVALTLAKTIARAHAHGIALGGLRPDLVFVGAAVTIAPRWARFVTQRATDPSVDVAGLGRLIAGLWPDRPDEVDALVSTMLVRDPARRPCIAEVVYALTCTRIRRAS